MSRVAKRTKGVRRRRRQSLRELRLNVPDLRLKEVRRRIAGQVARLDRRDEEDALSFVEAVSEFDSPDGSA